MNEACRNSGVASDNVPTVSYGACDAGSSDPAKLLDRAGRFGIRYGLVVVIGWIGAMKFTAYEADGISGLVMNSPLMGWAYSLLSHGQFSSLLGVVESIVAALIAAKPYWPRASAVGAAGAVMMFLTTLSFMVTTPGVFEPAAGGFPALSAFPGQFLVKDIALLGASVWLFADSLSGVRVDGVARSV